MENIVKKSCGMETCVIYVVSPEFFPLLFSVLFHHVCSLILKWYAEQALTSASVILSKHSKKQWDYLCMMLIYSKNVISGLAIFFLLQPQEMFKRMVVYNSSFRSNKKQVKQRFPCFVWYFLFWLIIDLKLSFLILLLSF